MKAKNSIKPSTVIVGCTIISAALFAGVLLASSKDIVLPETEVLASAIPNERSACLAAYDLAEMVMNLRQAGMSLPDMIEAAESEKGSREMVAMVEDAFSRPNYEMEENKDKAVKSFAESWYTTCKKQGNRK